jgi:ubiquinone/menaquinone biosynthesis C-methylase UbiE
MLAAARHRMRKQGIQNFEFARADIRAIPLAGQVADLVFLSWVLPPFVYSFSDAAWRGELDTAIREMFRICKPGGSIRILTPSWRGKRDYQSILCNEFTFSERQVRLRWKFSSRRQARRALCLWFGKKTWKRWRYLWSNGVLVESSFWHISK